MLAHLSAMPWLVEFVGILLNRDEVGAQGVGI